MTDYWRPYEQFVPKELHTQSKAETYTVEGFITVYSGIFLPGCAENQNAIAKARSCSNIPSCF
jgi:hypothetical protein